MLYFDNAATSWPKPEEVYTTLAEVLKCDGGNPGRGGHALAEAAYRHIINCRNSLANFLRVKDSHYIILTSGTTEGMNLILKGLLNAGDIVVTTSMEHNSVMRPLMSLKKNNRIEVKQVKADESGYVDPLDIQKVIKGARALVFSHGSNVTGAVQDLAELCNIAHEDNVFVIVDAAQTVGCYPFTIENLEIDALAFSGHKALMGPPGTGAVYLSKNIADHIRPWLEGGTGSKSEELIQPTELPDRFESGTLNLPGYAGLKVAVEFVKKEGVKYIAEKEQTLFARLWEGLDGHDKINLYGPSPDKPRTGTLSINIKNQHPSDVSAILDSMFGIASRPGLHCAPVAHQTIGTFPEGTVRLSVGYYTTKADIDATVEAIIHVAEGL